MDIGKIVGKIPKWLKQYRYPILILLVGVILLTVPGKNSSKETTKSSDTEVSQTRQQDKATMLAELLSCIDGVGETKVMLMVSAGEKTLYQTDENSTAGDGSSSLRTETVIITDSNRNEQALVTQIIPEIYQGAIIVCRGGDDPKVKLAVVDAVSKATGLGANQISVLKMN